MKIHLVSGLGTGPTKMAAFDASLHSMGIANYNLLRLSSVIPPGSEIIMHEDGYIPADIMPGQWGDRLYIVMADQRIDTPNTEAWAGIGWVQDKKTGKGLFTEHEGRSEQKVRREIQQTLEALMATRNVDFGPIQMKVVGRTCITHPVSATVIAVFQASDWDNNAHLVKE